MIRTVKGEIDKLENGRALIHEHISCVSNNFLNAFGEEWLDRQYLIDYAANILKLAKEKYNLNLFVDGSIMEIGRNANLLKEISKKSDVFIVASTGFYLFHDFGVDGLSYVEMADFILKECQCGMDGTDVKPGILKCAGGTGDLSDELIKKHKCMGIVQKETGLPLYVHCEHKGNTVFEQIDILRKSGANIEKVVIGHCAKNPSFEYLEEILKQGCCISMDQCLYFKSSKSTISQSLLKANESGYGDKILVSNDYCIHSDFASRSLNGFHLGVEEQVQRYGYVFDELYKEFLKNGGDKGLWSKITGKNVIDLLDV